MHEGQSPGQTQQEELCWGEARTSSMGQSEVWTRQAVPTPRRQGPPGDVAQPLGTGGPSSEGNPTGAPGRGHRERPTSASHNRAPSKLRAAATVSWAALCREADRQEAQREGLP